MAAVTKKKKYSKKSKKNWRKHTDIKDVEEYLDEVRQEERTGGPVADKPDSSLFFVDTIQKTPVSDETIPKKSRKRKILKEDELLLPDSKIKAVGSKKVKQIKKNKPKDSLDSDSSDEELEVKKNKKKNSLLKSKKENKESKPKTNFDLWGSEDKPVGDEHYLRITRKTKIKTPKTAKRKVSQLPAVDVCAPGASYNPTYEDHQELLQDAHQHEVKKVKEAEKINRKVQWLSKEEAANLPTWEEEMSQGLFGDDDDKDDSESNSSDEDQGADYVKSVKSTDRKTKQQKRKEIEEKQEQREQEAEKDAKLKENEIYRLKAIKKEIQLKEDKIEDKIQKKEKLKKDELKKTKRLGRHAFEAPNLEIQLSDEITGNLRSLKPEGNLLTDRFKSFQKRNIVETRKKVIPHRKYALKEYEKRSYKQPCIKEI